MKEKWLFHGAVVPVDVETTAALVAEIKRLINVIGGMALAQPAQEPVAYQCKGIPRKGCNYLTACDRVCNKCGEIHHHHQMVANFTFPPPRPWVGLTREDRFEIAEKLGLADVAWLDLMKAIEDKLKEKNT